MLKNELLEILKDVAEDADINETIQSIDGFAKPLDINTIGLEDYKKLINENKTIQGYNQSLLDSAVSKGVESFKSKKMPEYIEKAIKEKANEGKTPEQIQLAKMQAKIEAMEAEKAQNELLKANASKLKDSGLTTDLAKYIKDDTDIEFFKSLIINSVETGVKERLNNSSYVPPKNDNNIGNTTKEQFSAMGYTERLKLYNDNPSLYAELKR